jgi:opacity protein-like surface antigen
MLGRSIAYFAVIGFAQQAAAEIIDDAYLRGSISVPNLSVLAYAEQPPLPPRPGTALPLLPVAAPPGVIIPGQPPIKQFTGPATANWTGIYFGPHVGGATGGTGFSDPSGFFATSFIPGTGPIGGLIAGGQAGFNLQSRSIVWGGEADISWTNLDGNTNCGGTAAGLGWICHTEANMLGTFTGRIGYAFGNSLLYVKGGAAWADQKYNVSSFFFLNSFAGNDTRWGWTIGAGFEHALTPQWSVKAEYNYMDFGTDRVYFPDQFGNNPPLDIHQDVHVLKMGVNYKLYADSRPVPSIGQAGVPIDEIGGWHLRGAADGQIEIGTRYWYSSGSFQKMLFDPFVTSQMNSRLTYDSLTAGTVEGFTRIENSSGVFAKGYLGIGNVTNGHLNDEDFPPGIVPYSNTLSSQQDGKLLYASADVGYDFWAAASTKAGAFIGYHYYNQLENAVGCAQIAGNPSICSPALPAGQLAITETEAWHSFRIGLAGDVMLGDRLKLSGDAAYLPYVLFVGSDNHWLRPDINPLPEQGQGTGVQLEAILSYLVTSQFSIGVGGRYWYMQAPTGTAQFPGGLPASPETFRTERYGAFAQAAYKFESGE